MKVKADAEKNKGGAADGAARKGPLYDPDDEMVSHGAHVNTSWRIWMRNITYMYMYIGVYTYM